MPTSSGDVISSVMVFSLGLVTAGALRPHAFLQANHDLFGTGACCTLKHLADARRSFAARNALYRLGQPVELAALRFIRQPAPIRRALRALLPNQHIIGFSFWAERRVGHECVSPGWSRLSPYHYNTTIINKQ